MRARVLTATGGCERVHTPAQVHSFWLFANLAIPLTVYYGGKVCVKENGATVTQQTP